MCYSKKLKKSKKHTTDSGFIATPIVLIVMSFVVIVMLMRGISQLMLADIEYRKNVRTALSSTSYIFADWLQNSLRQTLLYLPNNNQSSQIYIKENSSHRTISCKHALLNECNETNCRFEVSCTAHPFGFNIEHVRISSFTKEWWGLSFQDEINFFRKN